MQSYSEREALIKELKKDSSIRVKISQNDINRIEKNSHIEEKENYWLLAEHLKYLRRKMRETKKEEERKKLDEQVHITENYLTESQFGDRNVGRFNGI